MEMWTREILYFTGDEYFKHVFDAIDQAQHSIEMETYIFEKGQLAERLTEKLIQAHQRGVKVRMLIDGIGSPRFTSEFFGKFKSHGIKVRFYRVLPWVLQKFPGDSRYWYFRFTQRVSRWNSGTHRKFFLIDNRRLFVGSFNISDVHLYELKAHDAWKDLGAEVEGGEVHLAHRAFQRAYRRFRFPNWKSDSSQLLLLNDSFIHKRSNKLQKLQRIRDSQRRIWLQTPYFIPQRSLLRSLVKRARAGVDVKLMVPERSDVWFVQWMSLSLLTYLAKRKVHVYIYQPRFAHQKVFILDNWMCLGSTNLNHRSFLHDLEMDVVVTHPNNKTALETSFLRDLNQSTLYRSEDWKQFPLYKRLIGKILLFGRYWS